MAISTYGDIGSRTAAHAATEFLKHVMPVLVLSKFGQMKPLPRNKTQTVKFRRAVPYPAATVPLQEGVTPSVSGTQFEDVTVQILQWGDVHGLTDVIADTHEDPVLREMMGLAGEQAGRTVEQVIYNVVKGGTSVFYANGSARSAVNTTISLNKQRAVTRYLKAQKAKKLTKMLAGSVNVGTSPIEAAYVAITHTDLEPDIRGLAGFIPTADYGTLTPICPEEIGSVEDVRYICSPDLEPWESVGGTPGSSVLSANGSNADVYPVLFFGADAYGLTPLGNARDANGQSNMSVKPTVINPNTPSASDPLGQRGYVGWKTYFNAVRLNETWMCRLEVAASAL
jgi:N4-gp56 family major capsid protein